MHTMWTKRAGDLIAAFVVGNGVLDFVAPRQRVLLWVFGPESLRKLARARVTSAFSTSGSLR